MKPIRDAKTAPFMANFAYNKAFPRKPAEMVLGGLRRGQVGAMCGDGGVGKTYLMIQKAMELATGRCGAAGATLYLDLENSLDMQAARQMAVYDAFYGEGDDDALSQNLHFWPEGAQNIDLLEDFDTLFESIEFIVKNHSQKLGCEFKLFVFDTLRNCHRASEKDDSDMGLLLHRFKRLAEEFKVAVMFVHHSSKHAGDQGSMHAMRGSSVLSDNIKYQLNLAVMPEAEAPLHLDLTDGSPRKIPPEKAGEYVRETVAKNNDGFVGDVRWYRRSACGVLVPAALEKAGARRQAEMDEEEDMINDV